MVNKTVPEVPKIAKTTRKRKFSKTSPDTANKRRIDKVIDVTEDEMAEENRLIEEVARGKDKAVDTETASDKENEREVDENEKKGEAKKNDPKDNPT